MWVTSDMKIRCERRHFADIREARGECGRVDREGKYGCNELCVSGLCISISVLKFLIIDVAVGQI